MLLQKHTNSQIHTTTWNFSDFTFSMLLLISIMDYNVPKIKAMAETLSNFESKESTFCEDKEIEVAHDLK